jgi:hypothetical protein
MLSLDSGVSANRLPEAVVCQYSAQEKPGQFSKLYPSTGRWGVVEALLNKGI